jgi:uncharacterized membrane protein
VFQFSESLEIERPASEVWPYLAAIEQVPTWEHGILEVRVLTPRPVGVGSEISAGRVYAGKAVKLSGSVTEWEEGRAGTIELRGGPLTLARVRYSVEPIDDARCRVTYAASGQLSGALRFLERLAPASGIAETRKNLARLRRRILLGIPPTSSQETPD